MPKSLGVSARLPAEAIQYGGACHAILRDTLLKTQQHLPNNAQSKQIAKQTLKKTRDPSPPPNGLLWPVQGLFGPLIRDVWFGDLLSVIGKGHNAKLT